ncbi:type II toxin-antitoxin system prevent-host-death family antitoxin [bacterium]|nr:type II toxin-antitoxin system prevent-host-death family antitoxin [bacterium]
MNALSVDEASTKLSTLIDQAASSHEPILITGQQGEAVLVSAEDWHAIQETLYLLAIPGMRDSIK